MVADFVKVVARDDEFCHAVRKFKVHLKSLVSPQTLSISTVKILRVKNEKI